MTAGNNISPDQLHKTGRPDTPIEALTEILKNATHEEDVMALRNLVQEAYMLTKGLDPYLEKISTPPSAVSFSRFFCFCCRTLSVLRETIATYISKQARHLAS